MAGGSVEDRLRKKERARSLRARLDDVVVKALRVDDAAIRYGKNQHAGPLKLRSRSHRGYAGVREALRGASHGGEACRLRSNAARRGCAGAFEMAEAGTRNTG